jgi:aspartate aminotransferase-like enzyme
MSSNKDEDDLLEYSVIYTDRAKNLMAASFSQAYKDISRELCAVYQADHCVLIPGSGSYAMEAVASQFARHKSEANYKPALVIRNGYFSFRWTDIWNWIFPPGCGRSPELHVVKAVPTQEPGTDRPSFCPPDIGTAVAQIQATQPCVVFAPHVETSDGIILSDEYIQMVAQATHAGDKDAIFVLDCIASGNVWAKMKDLGVDVLITAPQKGWTSPASVGIAMMTTRAKQLMQQNVRGHSFCCNLSKWSMVADKYIATPGGFMYHTTLPTDALMTFRDVIVETKAHGFEALETKTHELGRRVRVLLEKHGFQSVAAEGCQAPTVVVSYMRGDHDKTIAAKFKQHGIQIAAGVPLKIDEPWGDGGPPTFRIGLFGLDKLQNVDKTVKTFEDALLKVLADN